MKFCAIFFVVTVLLLSSTVAKSKKYRKAMVLRQKETNAINFIRLAVMRLVYGIATRVGLGEQISEALNGAFVPPGVDDDYDYGFLDRHEGLDDYDY